MNARLTLDRSATHSKYDKQAIKLHIVLDTWVKTLKKQTRIAKELDLNTQGFSGCHCLGASRGAGLTK